MLSDNYEGNMALRHLSLVYWFRYLMTQATQNHEIYKI